MALLYFWRGDNYRRDLDFGAGYHLNQGSATLHQIDLGQTLWAFTRRTDGSYVLAAGLVAKAKTLNPRGFRYGRYRLWGDLTLSRYFQLEGQPDITVLIRSLSIKANGDTLGRAFQGHAAVRRLTEGDNAVLRDYAVSLPLERRARLVPEERLEALLLAGDEESVAALIRDEPSGLIEQRKKYLMSDAIRRNRLYVEELRNLYKGRCQVCSWEPRAAFGIDLCEAHHVRWLGRGGIDGLSNLVLLCPNHHRAVHRLDAPFDWSVMGFDFGTRQYPLQLLEHQIEAD